jgi:uncharacterized protein (TIGR03437 family)
LTATLSASANSTAATTESLSAATPAAFVHSDGAQTITQHADGTQSVRSLLAAPVDVRTDSVAVQFYVSGLRDASNVRAQIAGQDVPVLYSGRAAHFAGLDQVSVQLPRSLAGTGETEVLMTVDGRTANPVRIRIQ